jgi:hypothetical protein
MVIAQRLASASRRRPGSGPSASIVRVRQRRERLSGIELGHGPAKDVDERAGCVLIGDKLREAGRGITDRSHEPKGVTRFAARAMGDLSSRTADRGQSEDTRCPDGERNRISADERKAVSFTCRFDAAQELLFPTSRPANRQRQQGSRGRCTLCCKVGKIDRNQLPPDADRRIVRKEMDALGHAIVGDHEAVEQRDVVSSRASGVVAIQRNRS